MNGHPAPQHPLARPLRACARGIYPDEAAIELLIGHGTFLDRDDFTRHITTGEHGRPGGQAAHAAIDWTAAATALDAGTLPCSGGERRIFRLAASLAAGLPVNLRDALTGLDEHNLTLAISAFIHASGHRPPRLNHDRLLVQRSYRLWHLPARLVRHARKRVLNISATWPWKEAFTTCWQRLCALPAPS